MCWCLLLCLPCLLCLPWHPCPRQRLLRLLPLLREARVLRARRLVLREQVGHRHPGDAELGVLLGVGPESTALRPLPLFWSAACQVTAHPPMDEAMRLVHEIERRPGILSVTLATGFPWADVPHMGPSVIVVADGDPRLARPAWVGGSFAVSAQITTVAHRLMFPRKPVGGQIGRFPRRRTP